MSPPGMANCSNTCCAPGDAVAETMGAPAWRSYALRPTAPSGGRYERFAKFLADRGLIKAPPPVGTYAVDLAR